MISHGYSDICSIRVSLICSLTKYLFPNLPIPQKYFLCILRAGNTVLTKLFRLDTTRPDYSIRTPKKQSFPSFCKILASFVYFKVLIWSQLVTNFHRLRPELILNQRWNILRCTMHMSLLISQWSRIKMKQNLFQFYRRES